MQYKLYHYNIHLGRPDLMLQYSIIYPRYEFQDASHQLKRILFHISTLFGAAPVLKAWIIYVYIWEWWRLVSLMDCHQELVGYCHHGMIISRKEYNLMERISRFFCIGSHFIDVISKYIRIHKENFGETKRISLYNSG